MHRTATPSDRHAVLAIVKATGLFGLAELPDIAAMFDAQFGLDAEDQCWTVDEEAGAVVGAAYFASEAFTQGVWNLYMLVVHPSYQGGGRGAALVRHVEEAVAERDARILLIETSGIDSFAPQRRFYAALGYAEEARIRDYYEPGDDKVVFWKALAS